jgi:phospholipid/cholesterol/gamma-HCH transport system substrate-binding protein
MSAPTNHWKLGLFVVTSTLVGLCALVYLGARTFQEETVSYKSYFDEGVSGLENGSGVTFRGVKIGTVSSIDVAPDRRHVEVTYELVVSVLHSLGLAAGKAKAIQISVPDDLRVQIGSNGLTGTKYLQIDFFDTKNLPAPSLPFPVPKNYIPAAPSTMDAVMRAVDQLPELVRATAQMLNHVNMLLADVRAKEVPDKLVALLASAERVVKLLRGKLDALEVGEISSETQLALSKLNVTLAAFGRVLERLDGDQGLVASLQRTSDLSGDVVASARGLAPQIGDTVADLREAGVAIRLLVEAIERDPDMLVKGRAKVEK